MLPARTALAGGDVPAFSALFDTAGADHPQRRFHARLALIDAGFSVTAQASEGLATRVSPWPSLTMLEATRGEPTMLNYAGVALYELWSLDAAQALFARRAGSTRRCTRSAISRRSPAAGAPGAGPDRCTPRCRASAAAPPAWPIAPSPPPD